MPRGLIETAADPYCVQLYGYFDAVQGDGRLGFRAHGDQFIVDTLGWGKSQTVRDHALHLAASGWVAIHKADTPSGAHKTTSYEVIHNPRRGRINENATTPIRKVRARPASRVDDLINNPRGSRRRASKVRQSTNGVVRQTYEVANNVGREKRDVLGTQKGNQKKNISIFDDLDPEGYVADASEEILAQAPSTTAPQPDDATLERLFAEDVSADLDWLFTRAKSGARVGMTADEGFAAILWAFPGAELLEPDCVGDDRYRCAGCGTSVVPAPTSIERGWRTICTVLSGERGGDVTSTYTSTRCPRPSALATAGPHPSAGCRTGGTEAP